MRMSCVDQDILVKALEEARVDSSHTRGEPKRKLSTSSCIDSTMCECYTRRRECRSFELTESTASISPRFAITANSASASPGALLTSIPISLNMLNSLLTFDSHSPLSPALFFPRLNSGRAFPSATKTAKIPRRRSSHVR